MPQPLETSTTHKTSYDQEDVPLQVITHSAPIQHQVLTIPVPSDHIVWSIFSLIYCNPCCLGLVALLFSVKSRDQKILGDYEGAKWHGKTACCINALALCIIIAFIAISGYSWYLFWIKNIQAYINHN